ESTTSHTYNFWLSNLSSPPEGSTLVAIPTTQLGDCLFKPSGPTIRMSILLVITGTALRYISQSRTVPDATYIPLGLIYPRGKLGRAVPVPHRYYLHFGNLRTHRGKQLAVRGTQPLPLPTSALIRFAPTPV